MSIPWCGFSNKEKQQPGSPRFTYKKWLLLHVEVQGDKEKKFTERIFIYTIRSYVCQTNYTIDRNSDGMRSSHAVFIRSTDPHLGVFYRIPPEKSISRIIFSMVQEFYQEVAGTSSQTGNPAPGDFGPNEIPALPHIRHPRVWSGISELIPPSSCSLFGSGLYCCRRFSGVSCST